ncbi:heme-binding protein [Thermomonospora umbrina]|nr:heme-binding protein [Thermomonospora umbrina]
MGGAAVFFVVASGTLFAAGSSHAARTTTTVERPRVEYVLSDKSLARAAKAAVRAAKREGRQRVTVVIMERSGIIRLVVRTRRSGPQTYESAKRKAYTAVAFGQPTSRLTDNPVIDKIPGTLTLPGGVPVTHKGFPIAGVGVGGAPDGRIDERIARAVRSAL